MENVSFSFSLTDNKELIESALEAAIDRGLEAVGGQAVDYVALLTPGRLRGSWTHVVDMDDPEGETVFIGTDVEYAPYVEFGTGKNGDNPTGDGWWVYVPGSEGEPKNPGKRYTEQEARRIVAILRSKGIDAHMTQGQKPKHMLRDGLEKHKNEYKAIMEAYLSEAFAE